MPLLFLSERCGLRLWVRERESDLLEDDDREDREAEREPLESELVERDLDEDRLLESESESESESLLDDELDVDERGIHSFSAFQILASKYAHRFRFFCLSFSFSSKILFATPSLRVQVVISTPIIQERFCSRY